MQIRASEAYAVSLCPGRLRACNGLPENRDPDPIRDSGTRIHKADAGEPVEPPLTEEEKESVAQIQERRKSITLEHAGDASIMLQIIREREYRMPNFCNVSGHPDCVEIYRLNNGVGKTRAIITDAKTGWKEQTIPALNLQLRVYAYLVFVAHPEVDEIVCALIPTRFKVPPPVLYTRREHFEIIETELFVSWNAASNPDAKRIPGEEQCRYCKARATDRCPETIPTNTQLFKAPPESLLKSMTPEKKGKLLEECIQLEKDIEAARALLFKELKDNPEAVTGWKIGVTKGSSAIVDAQEAYAQLQDYFTAEEFAMTCKPLKGKIETALKGKLAKLQEPIKGMGAAKMIKALLDPITVTGFGKPKLEKIKEELTNE